MPSYPLTFPSAPKFNSFSVREEYTTPASISPFTGDEQVFEFTGSGRISWDATIPPMMDGDPNINTWIQFFRDLHGRYGTFTLNVQTCTTIDYLSGQSSLPTTWRSRNSSHGWEFTRQRVMAGFTIQAIEA